MKTVLKLLFISIVGIFVLTGCGRVAKVQNIDNSGYIDGQKINELNVENAIKKGAIKRGWMVKKVSNGLLEAQNTIKGKYFVIINISYNTNGYKIMYKNSQNLNYDAESNTIHQNYNKWISNLEKDINYELSTIGLTGNVSSRETTTIEGVSAPKKTQYSEISNIETQGKIIYIKSITPYAQGNAIADNIKAECIINQQLAEFIQKYSQEKGLTIQFKDRIDVNDLYLDVQIDDAISQGGAFRGHNKFTSISGTLVQGKKSFGSFKAARVSGGGAWGGYKGSCAVLGRTVETLGKDVSGWLHSPINGAKLGDAGYIR